MIEPIFVYAECHQNCDDRSCPYTHESGWYIDGAGPFEDTNEAQEFYDAIIKHTDEIDRNLMLI